MSGERPRYGSLVSALGAVVLAISVFLPWYGVSFTARGVAYTQQIGSQVAAQFGNATLQGYVGSLHARLGGLVGHEFVALSAHQALHQINVVLLIIAALGTLIALFSLAGAQAPAVDGDRGPLALLGGLAAALALYRIAVPPTPAGELLAMSLREGAWLALLGALAMVGGAVYPRRGAAAASPSRGATDAWSELSGWTPET